MAYLTLKKHKQCLIEGEVFQYQLVGHLNSLFAPRGGNLNKLIFGGLPGGGDVEASI